MMRILKRVSENSMNQREATIKMRRAKKILIYKLSNNKFKLMIKITKLVIFIKTKEIHIIRMHKIKKLIKICPKKLI